MTLTELPALSESAPQKFIEVFQREAHRESERARRTSAKQKALREAYAALTQEAE
jgi:hypothetical protein